MRKLFSFLSNLKTAFIRALPTLVLPTLVILNNPTDDTASDSQPGVRNQFLKRVRKIIKRTQMETIFYLGVRKGVQLLFGGTQRGTILIWE